MLLRRIARPLFASWFISEGWDAARRPEPHALRARGGVEKALALVPRGVLAGALEGYREPTAHQLSVLVRLHGAATATAGLMLATGKAPRTAALALAALTAPLVLTNLPRRDRSTLDKDARRERNERLVRALAFTGGALLAGIDYEGRPGVAWRVARAREEHASTTQ
jgi:uncharacterized membrane protein YphA (DoxX/SURF4 family)